jgi:hypothetical protein
VRLRRFTGEAFMEEEATGVLQGDHLALEGQTLVGLLNEPVAYALTFDRAAEAWRGTRNGRTVTLNRDRTTACQTDMPTTAVRGWVYDEQGRTLPGAAVTFRSLNPSYPFELRVVAVNGSYTAYRVPTGVNMAIEAAIAGRRSTTRERQFSFRPRVGGTRLHFGGQATPEDGEASAYPLKPEQAPSPAQ